MKIQKLVTYTMFGHLRDVVKGDLVWVSWGILSILAIVVCYSTDDTGVSVLEGSMSTEISSFLLICVFFSHFS